MGQQLDCCKKKGALCSLSFIYELLELVFVDPFQFYRVHFVLVRMGIKILTDYCPCQIHCYVQNYHRRAVVIGF